MADYNPNQFDDWEPHGIVSDISPGKVLRNIGMRGATSAHYIVYRPSDDKEVGKISNFEDADLFARVLAEITHDQWHVIEHKFEETTLAVYGGARS